MVKEKRRTAADWDRLVSKFEAAGSRNLVGFAKSHGVNPVRLQDRWYRIKRRRWETGEEGRGSNKILTPLAATPGG